MGSGLIRACDVLGLSHHLAPCVINETNSVAERYVQGIHDGMLVLLVRAGRPAALWPYDATCYVMLCNITDMKPNQEGDPGTTKWHARTGTP